MSRVAGSRNLSSSAPTSSPPAPVPTAALQARNAALSEPAQSPRRSGRLCLDIFLFVRKPNTLNMLLAPSTLGLSGSSVSTFPLSRSAALYEPGRAHAQLTV